MRKILTKIAAEQWDTLLGVGVTVAAWLIFGLRTAVHAIGVWFFIAVLVAVLQLIGTTGLFRAIGRIFKRPSERNDVPLEASPPQLVWTRPAPLTPWVTRLRIRQVLLTLWAIAVISVGVVGQPLRLALAVGMMVILGGIASWIIQGLDEAIRSLMDEVGEPPGPSPSDGSPVPDGEGS